MQQSCMQVSLVMTDRLGKTKMKTSDFAFKPLKNWFGGDQTEKIEGWKTYVYEAAGKMKAVTITKVGTRASLCLPCQVHLQTATGLPWKTLFPSNTSCMKSTDGWVLKYTGAHKLARGHEL